MRSCLPQTLVNVTTPPAGPLHQTSLPSWRGMAIAPVHFHTAFQVRGRPAEWWYQYSANVRAVEQVVLWT